MALEEPPHALLQLVGHDVRWNVLCELVRSDRTVTELTELAGRPQNLVSYHLAKLRDGGLVSSRRSSADGRDTFYRAELGRLATRWAGVGSALHPGLAARPATAAARWVGTHAVTASVLFLCTGNSARSQVAEALVGERSGGRVRACSAGSHPKEVHPVAVRVLQQEYGIDWSGHDAEHLDRYAGATFDRIVTLCDRVHEICPQHEGGRTIHWSLPDPSATPGGATYEVVRQMAADLDDRIGFLLAELDPSIPAPNPPMEEP